MLPRTMAAPLADRRVLLTRAEDQVSGWVEALRARGARTETFAGVRIAPPYRWDLAGLARTGENMIEIDVTNTAQARWKDEFSHGDAVSGLIGPVWLLRIDGPGCGAHSGYGQRRCLLINAGLEFD